MYFHKLITHSSISILIIIIIIISSESQSISEVKIFNKFLIHPPTSTQHLKSIIDNYLINPCYMQGYHNDHTKTIGSGSYMHCYTIITQYLKHLNMTNTLQRHNHELQHKNHKTYLSLKFQEIYQFINQKRIPLRSLIEDTVIICHMNYQEFKLRYSESGTYDNICFKLIYIISLIHLSKVSNNAIIVFAYPKQTYSDVSIGLKAWIGMLIVIYLISMQLRAKIINIGYKVYMMYKKDSNDNIIESTCLSLPVLQRIFDKEAHKEYIREAIEDNKISMKQYYHLIKTIIKIYNTIEIEIKNTIIIRTKMFLSIILSISIIILLMMLSFSFIILIIQIDYDTQYSYGGLIIITSLICSLLSIREIVKIIQLWNDLPYYYSNLQHFTLIDQSITTEVISQ